jgi:hypothetical protein
VAAPISDRLGADALAKGLQVHTPRSVGHTSIENHAVSGTQAEFLQIARSGLVATISRMRRKACLWLWHDVGYNS